MYGKKKIYDAKNSEINSWAQIYTESLTEKELSESTSDEDILNTVFETLLYFLNGEGDKVLKDTEWKNYIINDINSAIQKGMFKPSFQAKQQLKKLQGSDVKESDVDEE